MANRSWVSSACFSEIQSRSRAAPVSSSCEQSEQPEEPAPMHNGLRLAVWIKESEQLSSMAYCQTDYVRHFCHVPVAFKTRNTLAWWEMTCLEKKLCEIWRGCVTWREVRLFLQGCKRFLKKNKVCRKNQNFWRGDPYKLGQTPLWRTKVSKAKHCFGGFLASKLHESFWIW